MARAVTASYLPFMFKSLFRKTPPSLPEGERVYAIGDIHGRLDLLDSLVAKIEEDNARRPKASVRLILLGDLIDRGPHSREVVERARAGIRWARLEAIMGNHEAVMLDVLDGNRDALSNWLRFGGRETMISWGVPEQLIETGTLEDIERAIREAVSSDDLQWMRRMRSFLRIGDYYFVHAGVRPDLPLSKQIDDDRLWIREEFLESRKKLEAMIVHGHSIQPEVEELTNRIGIDTGAYKTGRLTAIGLEGSARWFIATPVA